MSVAITDPTPPVADEMNGLDNITDDVDVDYDSASEEGRAHGPSTDVERRRAQTLIFDAWLAGEGGQALNKQKSEGPRAQEDDDATLSIQGLLANQGGRIKEPRQYQLELFERAKKENTIAVLDTGSGKTLIAVLLLKWIIDLELDTRPPGQRAKTAFFVVASVTLVHQQFHVLEQNLDHKVARISGADNTSTWKPGRWQSFYDEHRVVVCTADILHQSLSRSYTSISQINLLVFDEAHHAKKNHAFARIVKDFYVTEEDESRRPRIFGMTASPIDAKADVRQAALELETLLHSKIATTIDMSFTDTYKATKEQILKYDPLPSCGFNTPLLRATRAQFPDLEPLHKHFRECQEIARQLGPWCADEHLANVLAEGKLHKFEHRAEFTFYHNISGSGDREVAQLDGQLAKFREAVNFVRAEHAKQADIGPGDINDKVKKLLGHLRDMFERPSSHRCIVFVQKRSTANILNAVARKLGPVHLRSGFLTGGAGNNEEDRVTFRHQVLTLIKFRRGDINCLFATSVAEEGLDVPDCNLVIRFDMYRTMIQYVQSRGRARRQNSTFVHMLETGNTLEANLCHEVRWQEKLMRGFCTSLPADRQLIGNTDLLESLMEKEQCLPVFKIQSTGAKLTYGNALSILQEFVAAIPGDSEEAMHPAFVMSGYSGQFIAEVLLPGNAPLRSVMGQPQTRKSLAKRSAAFQACRQLREKKYINEYLKPVYQKKLPEMRNALLAANMNKSDQYDMRTKPSAWVEGRGTNPSKLWATVVDYPENLQRPHQPLVLLTRSALPKFPEFNIFLNDARASIVSCSPISQVLPIDAEVLQKMTRFTLAIFEDVFSKVYEDNSASLSYWITPALPDRKELAERLQAATVSPESVIDWTLLDEAANPDGHRWTPEMPSSQLVNKFIVDPWNGGRKFYSTRVVPELSPQDPVPEGFTKNRKWTQSILQNSISLWKNSSEKAEDSWRKDQPVIEAELLRFRRNTLSKPTAKEMAVRTQSLLCPEPLRISPIPPTIAESCYFWPAVIHRIESYLIAQEACQIVGVDCGLKLALAAVTKDSENSGDGENVEKINFQAGMGENYERLEFIGDTFLKTATTIATFVQNPDDNEFDFHVKRMLMLCNKNLFNAALELKLYEYIRTMAFSRRLWYPEGLKLLAGKGADKGERTEGMKHPLGKKTIADVCEAMIGASFITHDRPNETWCDEHWQNAISTVTKLVSSEDHRMQSMQDYRNAYAKPAYQTGEVSASHRDLAEKVEQEHAYRFRYPKLLRSAFIHPSQAMMVERVPNYQRLEFLGDALLDMASIAWIFYRFPDKDPQWLTEHKMAMVSNKFLGAVCVEIGFHRHLRHSSAVLQKQISEYADELLEAKRMAGDSRDYWTTVSDPPKCLPDVIESFIGAMFVDSDFDYNVVQEFFEQHIKWYFEDMSVYDTFANNHPCTHLYNLLQTTYACMDYRVMAREIPTVVESEKKDVVAVVMIHNEIIAHSKGKSARYARLRVAQRALEAVEGLAPVEFRRRFGCNCHLKSIETELHPRPSEVVDCGT